MNQYKKYILTWYISLSNTFSTRPFFSSKSSSVSIWSTICSKYQLITSLFFLPAFSVPSPKAINKFYLFNCSINGFYYRIDLIVTGLERLSKMTKEEHNIYPFQKPFLHSSYERSKYYWASCILQMQVSVSSSVDDLQC